MSATLRKLEGEPILIVTHQGFLDIKAVEAVTVEIAQALAESDVPLYGIIDLRTVTTNMGELMRILVHQATGTRGTVSDRQGNVVLVGSHPLIRIFRRLLQRETFGGLLIPIFSTLEEALTFTRKRIRKEAHASS